MRGRSCFRAFVILTIVLLGYVVAQDAVAIKVNCGDTIEGEFTKKEEYHSYIVSMNPGDKLKVSASPIGAYLFTRFVIREPAGNEIYRRNDITQTPVAETDVLSARGDYIVDIANYNFGYGGDGKAGIYTLYVSCTLRDGTVIEAGVSQ